MTLFLMTLMAIVAASLMVVAKRASEPQRVAVRARR